MLNIAINIDTERRINESIPPGASSFGIRSAINILFVIIFIEGLSYQVHEEGMGRHGH